MCMQTFLCTYIYTVYMCIYSLYTDVCMYVYAGIPIGTKLSLNYPSGGVSSPETQSPHSWWEVSASPPAAKASPGLRQSPAAPLALPAAQDVKEGPRRGTATLEAILPGCSTDTGDTPTHSHHTARVPPRREGGRGGEGKASRSPVFLCL